MSDQKPNQKEEFKRRLYSFVLSVIKILNQLEKSQVTKVFIDQLARSATSILANYIEAGASSSRKDYTNFFHHSLKSANESKVWLALLRDTQSVSKDQIDPLLKDLDEISKILAASIITLKRKK
jgi:four helix bundle protein